MVNVVCDGFDVRAVWVCRHESRIKVDLRLDVSRATRCGRRVRTITTPSRCPTPVPTYWSTSSGTFRGISRSARADEWLHITGARDILSAPSAVSSDVCERSTRTPRRLSSLTRVLPNGLCRVRQFGSEEARRTHLSPWCSGSSPSKSPQESANTLWHVWVSVT
jgi:hypothetical protein